MGGFLFLCTKKDQAIQDSLWSFSAFPPSCSVERASSTSCPGIPLAGCRSSYRRVFADGLLWMLLRDYCISVVPVFPAVSSCFSTCLILSIGRPIFLPASVPLFPSFRQKIGQIGPAFLIRMPELAVAGGFLQKFLPGISSHPFLSSVSLQTIVFYTIQYIAILHLLDEYSYMR